MHCSQPNQWVDLLQLDNMNGIKTGAHWKRGTQIFWRSILLIFLVLIIQRHLSFYSPFLQTPTSTMTVSQFPRGTPTFTQPTLLFQAIPWDLVSFFCWSNKHLPYLILHLNPLFSNKKSPWGFFSIVSLIQLIIFLFYQFMSVQLEFFDKPSWAFSLLSLASFGL